MNTYIGKDNRVRTVIKDENGKWVTKSYPRILMEEKLGRPLEPYEDVHHIDGNTLNNDLSNLELVMHGEHQKRHSTKYYDKYVKCSVCGKEFLWTSKRQRNYYIDLRRNKNRAITCSKRCSAYYGRREQISRNTYAECGLNGETSPNGNTVPNANN